MLFKISVKNIKNSIRDYTIYFLTLIIGVVVFYSFNAITTQKAILEISKQQPRIYDALEGALSGVSIFVAIVLGLLIVYASRFLMKRRSKEFALYFVLGMSKREISTILLGETLLVGAGSLAIGLFLGIGFSQLMSVFTTKLFAIDISKYRFNISVAAIAKTILFFGIIYLVEMIFNSCSVSRMKLIDLIQADKKVEKIKLKNSILCVIVFVIATGLLVIDYYMVIKKGIFIFETSFLGTVILVGCISTFLIFWSVSGMLLRVTMANKKIYYSGLNSFTFRQISSKVNTIVVSMSIICIMLFFSICGLIAGFSMRNSMNGMVKKYSEKADFEAYFVENYTDSVTFEDIVDRYLSCGYDLTSQFESYVHFPFYCDVNTDLLTLLPKSETSELQFNYYMSFQEMPDVIALSDYNSLMRMNDKETLTLEEDEFAIVCESGGNAGIFNSILNDGVEVTLFGNELNSKYRRVLDNGIGLEPTFGLIIAPDSIIDKNAKVGDVFLGNYPLGISDEQKRELSKESKIAEEVVSKKNTVDGIKNRLIVNTKIEMQEELIGTGALCTILGIYLGIMFIITCGALLALRELSNSVDSISRYEILRKIGVEEQDISSSIVKQIGFIFALPLILASVHSIFGIGLVNKIVDYFGTIGVYRSIFLTLLLLALLYGSYFVVTCVGSRKIVNSKR